MDGNFCALMFRMKYINRWSLMRSSKEETLSDHSLECCFITHTLALIGNKYFGKSYNTNDLVVKAAYHDAAEIITGDMPTPVKYYNETIKNAYETIEKDAVKSLIDLIPLELKNEYNLLFTYTYQEKIIIKAADTLCAYIKCLNEICAGNREFSTAAESIKEKISNLDCPESEYFMQNCIKAFLKNLDELKI